MSRRVAANAVWNIAGSLVSLLVGLLAISTLLKVLGPSRLGVFTLALGFIGFSGVLDLGLGRALTQKVASDVGEGKDRSAVSALAWHVLAFLAGFGIVAGVLVWCVAPWIVDHVTAIDPGMERETVFGLRAIALSMPLALVSVGATGALEGLQAFRDVSTRRALLSILQFGLPMAMVLRLPDVGWAIAGLATSRVIGSLTWLSLLQRLLPFRGMGAWRRGDLREVLAFGGWLSVSNAVGPLMVYADRFYLATLFPAAKVAHYAVPLDGLFRITSLPVMTMNAVFPALAGAKADPRASSSMLRIASVALAGLLVTPLYAASLFALGLLTLWLGAAFAHESLAICQWLIVGIFANSLAHVPYALLQGHGRSDVTAKLHLLELPVFVIAIILCVSAWGIVGAAIAWTLRVALDAALLYAEAMRRNPGLRQALSRGALFGAMGMVILLVPVFTLARPALAIGGVLAGTGSLLAARVMRDALRGAREEGPA